MSNLSEVFSETEETEVENSEIEQNEPDGASEAEEAGLDEGTTEEEATVEDDAATTAAEQDEAEPQEDESKEEKSNWEYAAWKDEKQKRQDLEKRLADLESQLTKEEPKEDDTDYISQSELKARIQAETQANVRQALFQDRLQRHYEPTKEKYEDFTEAEAGFAEMAKADPNLREQFIVAPNPAEFAYITYKNHEIMSKYNGNLMAALEDLKSQQGITEQKVKETPAKKPKTPSLANATESEKTSAPVTKGATLDDLFSDYAL